MSDGYLEIGDTAGVHVLDSDSNGASVHTHVVRSTAGYDSTPRIELATAQPVASVGPATMPIDFPSLFSTYRERAKAIAACADNVVLDDADGTPLPHPAAGYPAGTRGYITLIPGKTNVLKLSASELNNISELSFRNQPDASTPFVVVVDGEVGDWHTPNLAGVSGPQAPFMLWDFPDAATITITAADSLEGTLYAPSAAVTDLDASNIEGDIVAKSLAAGPQTTPGDWVNAGEIHNFPFAADLECDQGPTPPPTSATTPPTTPPTFMSTTPSTPQTPSMSSSTTPRPTMPYPTTPDFGPSASQPKPSASLLAATGGQLSSLTWLAVAGVVLTAAGVGMLRLRRRGPRGRHMA
jgi:choice-of-anchor A domain-containing protein